MNALMKAVVTGLCTCLAAASVAFAQTPAFPSRPVKIVVPNPPGAANDAVARILGTYLQETWKHPVIVENRPGAGGNIGTDAVAKSEPDGHTVVIGFNGPIAINSTLYRNMPFDPVKDLAPITLVGEAMQFLAVNADVPAPTLGEFVAYAKKNPGKLTYGSIGVGSASHLTMELFKSTAGVDLVHVTYKGGGPVVTDLIAGHIDATFLISSALIPQLSTGRLKVLAASGAHRSPAAPDVPTLIESGYPGFVATAWIGVLAPAKTPKPIVERWHRDIVAGLKTPEVRQRLEALDLEIVGNSPQEFARFISAEIGTWRKVVQATGATME